MAQRKRKMNSNSVKPETVEKTGYFDITEIENERDIERDRKPNFIENASKSTPGRAFSGLFNNDNSPLSPNHTLENGKIKLNFFEKPFDENGIIHYVSTEGMRQPYRNPHTTGKNL